MSRAYIIYFLMFVAAIGGLWVILTLGAAMKAPDDLSGEWTVTWEGNPPAEMDGKTMRISQSGRYFVIRFGDKAAQSFTLTSFWQGARDGRKLRMELQGDPWRLNLYGPIPMGEPPRVAELQLLASGRGDHSGTAKRIGSDPATRPAGVAHAR